MLFTLGQRTATGDVVDLLLACHHRIREHLALARRLASAPASTSNESIRSAAHRVQAYFSLAFPLHRDDEEGDIFPRLLGRSDALDAAIGQLVHDHEAHDRSVVAVVAICEALGRDPSLLPGLAVDLRGHVNVLDRELEAHIKLEEATLFPAISMMTVREREEIHRRMRERRGD
jgi:iron-sulfur cluster repair protein YtfE (RIC family)